MAKQRVTDKGEAISVKITRRKISIEVSQTVQLAKFHPCTATVGLEVELDAYSDLQAAKDAVTLEANDWLDDILRQKIEAGLGVLTDIGKTPII